MTSKLEELATMRTKQITEANDEDLTSKAASDCTQDFIAGAKAVLEFAKSQSNDLPLYGNYVLISELETFVNGDECKT